MDTTQLRVALFSGNYNYVRDGANQALNRLVGYLLRQGVAVRVYAPTVPHPAFQPTGDLVSVPSLPFPFGRNEYRFTYGMQKAVRDDLARFAPNLVHVSAPDVLGHRAIKFARSRGIPVVASMHTRFETYLRYYGLRFLEPVMEGIMRRFYAQSDIVLAPSPAMQDHMRDRGMGQRFAVWERGIDRTIFSPAARSLAWRQNLGIADDDVVIGFLGRLVMEKGLDAFASAVIRLRQMGVPHRVLIIGDGPARGLFEQQVPEAIFAGFLHGPELGRAVASLDVLLNPSVTETFGNIALEAMACALPIVSARTRVSEHLTQDHVTGRQVEPTDVEGYANALAAYCTDHALRLKHGHAALAASARFDWDVINSSVLDAYLAVCNGPPHD